VTRHHRGGIGLAIGRNILRFRQPAKHVEDARSPFDPARPHEQRDASDARVAGQAIDDVVRRRTELARRLQVDPETTIGRYNR
jgi:hypothetical protein